MKQKMKLGRKMLSIMLSLVMVIGVLSGILPGTSLTVYAEEEPIIIRIGDDGKLMKGGSEWNINNGRLELEPGSYKLESDLEISNYIQVNNGYANSQTTIDLNGYGIKYSGTNGCVIYANQGSSSKFILNDSGSTVHYYYINSEGLGVVVDNQDDEGYINAADENKGLFTGGYITGGCGYISSSMQYGGGIYASGGSVEMNGGTIIGNSCVNDSKNCNGGGICASSLTMNGGLIIGNKAIVQGGGVYAGTFTMNAGVIKNNICTSEWSQGGGVSASSTVTMNDGIIENNEAATGGGVVTKNLTMAGGKITGNRARKSAGGLYLYNEYNPSNDGNLNLKVGNIYNNEIINSSGNVNSNIYLISANATPCKINIIGELNNTIPLGISMVVDQYNSNQAFSKKGVFTNTDAANIEWNDESKFVCEGPYYVIKNGDGQLELVDGCKVVYNANGATSGTAPVDDTSDPYEQNTTVTVLDNTGNLEKTGYIFDGWNTKADGTGTDYVAETTFNITTSLILFAKWKDNAIVNPKVKSNLTYDGTSQNLVTDGSGQGLTYKYAIGNDDTTAPTTWSDTVPAETNAGTYYVWYKAINDGDNSETTPTCLTVEIAKKEATVTADNKSKVYGETDPALTATVTGTVGTDIISYTLARAEGKDVGTYTITPRSEQDQDNYNVTYETGTFTITQKEASNTDISAVQKAGEQLTYTGSANKPTIEVKDGTETLAEGTDYSIKYAGVSPTVYPGTGESEADAPQNIGNYKAAITFKGNYSGSKELEFSIGKMPQDEPAETFTTTKTTDENATDGKISGFDEGKTYQYSADNGTSWNDLTSVTTELNGVKAGTYMIRYAGDDNKEPGKAVSVTVGVKETQAAPDANSFKVTRTSTATSEDGVIKGVTDAMEYSTDNGSNWTKVVIGTTAIERLEVGDVKIRYAGTDDKNPSEPVTVTVGTKEDQNVPASTLFTPTKASNTTASDGTISGVTDAMEYKESGDTEWKKVPTGATVIEGLKAGDVEIRYAGTDDKNPSPAATVTIGVKVNQNPPAESFTATKAASSTSQDGTISGVDDTMEYSTDDGTTWKKVPTGTTVIEGLNAGVVKIRYAGNDDKNPSEPVSVTVPAKANQEPPVITGIKVTKTTSDTSQDGAIDGVNDTMEYSTDGGESWINVPAGKTVIEGLKAGDVKIRYAGTDDKNSSESVTVTMGTKENQDAPASTLFTPTKVSNNVASDGTISGVTDAMEYRESGDTEWKNAPTGATVIEGLKAGDVEIRYAGTDDKNPGPATTVTIGIKADQTQPAESLFTATKAASSTSEDGTISGVNDTMEYSTDDGTTWKKVPTGTTVIEDLNAGVVKIRYAGDNDKNPSAPVDVTVPAKANQEPPVITGIKVTKTTSDTSQDGAIDGVNDTMEYSTDGGESWKPVPKGKDVIENLPAGEVLIRYTGTDDKNPSVPVKVTVGTKEDQPAPNANALKVINATDETNADGKIEGLNPDKSYQYSSDKGITWKDVNAGETSINVKQGEYKIRIAGDDDHNPSEPVTVTVGVTSRTQGVVNFNKTSGAEASVTTAVEDATSSNIEEFAATQIEEGKDVKVEIEIIPRKEKDVNEDSVMKIGDTVKEVFAGIETESIVTEYLQIDLAKYVDNAKEGNISDTKTPLEIELIYDKSKMSNPIIVRNHNGIVKSFEKLMTRPTGDFRDGTYHVTDGKLYLYSQYFSDFAIVYATEKTYYVNIDLGNGESIQKIVGEDDGIEIPADLTREGYSFGGLFKDASYKDAWNYDTDKVKEDITLYGKWNKSVTGVKVDVSEISLTKAGETIQLKVDVTPSDAANTNVTYKSSDTMVAAVDEDGKITAVANGTTTITITTEDGAKTATVNVTVAIPDVSEQGESAEAVEPVEDTNAVEQRNTLAINAGLKISQTGSKINIKWGKVTEADGYDVYVTYCGQSFNHKKPVKTVGKNSTVKVTISKINGKKINLKKNFKVYVAAYKMTDGKKEILAKTITGHVVGRKNTKYSNAKNIKITSKTKVSIKVGKTSKIKAKTVLVEKGKKQLSNAHAKEFRYASSNNSIATVDAKGKIKAVSSGTCTIYVYSRNGYAKKVSVMVK